MNVVNGKGDLNQAKIGGGGIGKQDDVSWIPSNKDLMCYSIR